LTVSLSDFLGCLRLVEGELKAAADSALSAFDRITYSMLVDCLKSEDPAAVKEAIDQLVKEERAIAIPPLYLVAHAHPVPWVRQQASAGLQKLGDSVQIEKLTAGKDTLQAVKLLVEEYGHYKMS